MDYRPIYHFLPKKNWMNDPNGVCWYQGFYHLFYQYNPTGDQWGNLHWGHAISEDCVHWKHLPVGLYPSNEKGEVHCYSGCCNVDGEYPVIYYTSIGRKEDGWDADDNAQQWCAVSHDGMMSFEKWEKNPALTKDMHGGLKVREWRDPFVWKEEDGWYMVLGSEVEGKGTILLYHSSDQFNWSFEKILFQGEKDGVRSWECPNYFKLGEYAVLVMSPFDMPRYWYGKEEKGHTFIPEGEGIMDHSGFEGFYAPNSFVDPEGRRIMFGWLTEMSRGKLQIPGWQGVQSLPRALTMKKDGLHMAPIPELHHLRSGCEELHNISISGEKAAKTRGRALEILATFQKNQVGDGFEIQVFASPDGEEKTSIRFCKERDCILIDRTKSNASGLTSQKELSCPAAEDEAGRVTLDIFLDYSTLEVFVSERESISTRAYPEREDSEEVRLCAEGAVLDEVLIFEMQGIGCEDADLKK